MRKARGIGEGDCRRWRVARRSREDGRADPEQVKAGFKQVLEKFGRLDILVNTPHHSGRLALRMKQDDWDAVIRTNLTGATCAIQQAMHTDDAGARRPHHQHFLPSSRRPERRAGQHVAAKAA